MEPQWRPLSVKITRCGIKMASPTIASDSTASSSAHSRFISERMPSIDSKNWWSQEAFRLGVSAAVHPFEYAKLLIQIGYEPIAPRPSKTFFGRPVLALPSVFEYIGYIYKQRGFRGLYQGATSRVCGSFVSSYVYGEVLECLPFGRETNDSETPAEDVTEEDRALRFFQVTGRGMIAQCAAVLASQPFQVITVRTIAQFVGGEMKYAGIWSSIREIYVHDGISGFFAGLIPRMIGELLSLWLSSCLTFVINSYLIKDKELKVYTKASMCFIAVAVTYPFMVVSKVMSVNNSGLAAGRTPHMPIYSSWTDCWSQLKAQNQLKRGSSVLFRYYTGPVGMKQQLAPPPTTNVRSPASSKSAYY